MIFEKNVSVQKLVLFCSPDQCQSLCLDAKGFGWRNTHLRRYTEWAPLNWKRERDRGRFCMWVIEGEREIMRKRPRPIRSIDWAGVGCGRTTNEISLQPPQLTLLNSTQFLWKQLFTSLKLSCAPSNILATLTLSLFLSLSRSKSIFLPFSHCIDLSLTMSISLFVYLFSISKSIYLTFSLLLCLSIYLTLSKSSIYVYHTVFLITFPTIFQCLSIILYQSV